MRWLSVLMVLLTCLAAPLAAEEAGRLLEYENVPAAGLPDQRITIWLPPDYDTGGRPSPVLFMHDRHNLFDVAKSNVSGRRGLIATGNASPPRV